jgi:hypothetical protein
MKLSISRVYEIMLLKSENIIFNKSMTVTIVITSYALVKEYNVYQMYFYKYSVS